ncbi:MAG: thiamine pyrophosphate-dependent dehydrogenase E1 component subunit alpha [Sandaracinaceae bacterium]|nr:thiamine pyrophosphate-dependent dehydrogenase E1 component subunit alpha [Sandaracinaceae bacterium]
MEVQTTQSVIRTPEKFLEGVATVIGPDGRADASHDPKLDRALVKKMYVAMVRTRVIDERLVTLQRQGRIGFHIGSLGEEGCILASAAAMRDQDWIFPCYREFGALLWRGMPLQDYVNNMYGNANDPIKGRQMPDHYSGKKYKFGSVSSPIGTQMTQAVGFAWGAKIRKEDLVTSVYFGEGATSSNEFHTAMNFAGVFKTPTVLLCRNNGWAISVPSEKQTASKTFAEKGIAYGVKGIRCDGNDVLAVYKTVREAVERAAAGGGPTLIEMMTYRLSGHSTSDDPRAYRIEDEVTSWRKADPILRLRKHLETLGMITDAEDQKIRDDVDAELKLCIERAEATEKPALSTMFTEVFKDMPQHLQEQFDECAAGPRPKAQH